MGGTQHAFCDDNGFDSDSVSSVARSKTTRSAHESISMITTSKLSTFGIVTSAVRACEACSTECKDSPACVSPRVW